MPVPIPAGSIPAGSIPVGSIPAGFGDLLAHEPGWADWKARLPRLLGEVITEWGLTVEGGLTHGQTALVLPVCTDHGAAAVLKAGRPSPESRH
ncbi:MAG: hypothetical protein ACLGIF_01110, partial [Actinomycetes bacterium]